MVLVIQFIFTLKSVPEASIWPHAPPISRQRFPVFLGVLSHLPWLGTFRVNSLELLFCGQCPQPSRSAQCHQLPAPITTARPAVVAFYGLVSHSPRPVLTGPLAWLPASWQEQHVKCRPGRGMEWRGRAFCLPPSRRAKNRIAQ